MSIAANLRQTTFWASALSILPHVFCCGIPVFATLISLGTTVGLAASLASNPIYMFVDSYHTELLTLAVVMVAVSGLLNLIAYRIDCRTATHSSCSHGDCAPKKRHSFRLFFISLALLVADVAWFAAEEHILGLQHNHGQNESPHHGHHH